jgi:hypothetical protein
VRFYSGRLTLRYDLLEPDWLDRSLDTLKQFGFEPYALLEDWEEAKFRERFRGQRTVRLLDSPPMAVRRTGSNELRLFQLGSAAERREGLPDDIPMTSRFACIKPSPGFWGAGARLHAP